MNFSAVQNEELRVEGWKEYKLGELAEISSSKRIYAKEYMESGIPFYRSKEIIEKSNGNDISTELYISKERFNELKNKFGVPKKGDILLTSVGTLGVPYIVKDEEFYFKDGNLTWLKNFKRDCCNRFIYYWILSDYGKNQINSRCIGSTQKALTIDTLKKFDVIMPLLLEQKAIAHILSTIDEKIENNNQINKKLEEMAKAIFKQWFVDFEFPNEEGNPYKSSGGEMVGSEMGMIPKGWEVGIFREYTDTVLGGDWGKENPQGNYTKEVYCLRGADIPEVREGKKGALPKRYILEKNYNNKKLSQGDLVVEISGGSPTQSTGRISYINEFMLNKYDADFVCTNFCRAITLNNKDVMEFFYFYWTYVYDINIFFQYENGTTGIKNFDINTFLDKFLIVKPPKEIIYKFHNVVKSLLNTIQSNGSENIKLSETRDILLPKLMSGEIRVPLK